MLKFSHALVLTAPLLLTFHAGVMAAERPLDARADILLRAGDAQDARLIFVQDGEDEEGDGKKKRDQRNKQKREGEKNGRQERREERRGGRGEDQEGGREERRDAEDNQRRERQEQRRDAEENKQRDKQQGREAEENQRRERQEQRRDAEDNQKRERQEKRREAEDKQRQQQQERQQRKRAEEQQQQENRQRERAEEKQQNEERQERRKQEEAQDKQRRDQQQNERRQQREAEENQRRERQENRRGAEENEKDQRRQDRDRAEDENKSLRERMREKREGRDRERAEDRQERREERQEKREGQRDRADDRRDGRREDAAQGRQREERRERRRERVEAQRNPDRDRNRERWRDRLEKERRVERRGDRTIIREGDSRVIVRQGDRAIIRHDNDWRFRRNARDVDVTIVDGGRRRSVYRGDDGIEIITIEDRDGRLIRRSRRDHNGREFIIIDNERGGRWRDDDGFFFGIELNLPPLDLGIPRDEYIVEYEDASIDEIYETFEAPPVEIVERAYTLDEIRYSDRLRDKVRRVDLDTINFDFGAWEVPDDEIDRLEKIGEAMSRVIEDNPNEVFLIEGHTDAVGTEEANLALSDRRAESVAIILTDYFDIPAANLVTQGYGEEFLKIPTPEPERANRRVSIRRITPLMTSEVR